MKPPSLWGTETRLNELFGDAATIECSTRNFMFRAASPEHWLENFKTYYGPMARTFAAVDEAARGALTADLLALVASLNRAEDGTMVLPSEYLEVVIVK